MRRDLSAYRRFDGPFCRKQRKLAKIWRAIARRWRDAPLHAIVVNYHNGDADD
jgi:hypothetical protein